MKRWIKVSIILMVFLALSGIYYSKNSRNNVSGGGVKSNKNEFNWSKFDPEDKKNSLPVLIELGSPT